MLKIRPAIRYLLLGGVFFILFLNIIAYINSVSSLQSQHGSLISKKERLTQEQNEFENDIKKEAVEEVNSRNRQENLVRVEAGEIKRPIDIQPKPEDVSGSGGSESSNTEVGLIGR